MCMQIQRKVFIKIKSAKCKNGTFIKLDTCEVRIIVPNNILK